MSNKFFLSVAVLPYLAASVFFIYLYDASNLYLLFTLSLVMLFCIAPVLFSAKFSIEYKKKSKVSTVLLAIAVMLPMAILIYERSNYGFEITINPILMRDQMLERQDIGAAGSMISIVGNFLKIPAYVLIFDYILFKKNKNIIGNLFICSFFIFEFWISASRTLIILFIALFWGLFSFRKINLGNVFFLSTMSLLMVGVFLLRSIRSDIIIDFYVLNTLDHLQIEYSDSFLASFGIVEGLLILTFGYIFHSIQTFHNALFLVETPGISLGPYRHLMNIFSYQTDSFVYPGLFLSEPGNIYYDTGYIGLFIIFILKVLVIAFASRSKNFFAKYITLFLLINALVGILAPLYNILYFYLVFLALFISFIWRRKWIN